MVRHNEHSIKFLQLIDLLHVLQVTLADIRLDKFKKKRKKKSKKKRKEDKKRKEGNTISRLVKALLLSIR